MATSNDLKTVISQEYAGRISGAPGCCDTDESCNASYPLEVLDSMPEGVVSFGCGTPTTIGSLKSGEWVLDLGSGAGLDCFLAAREVGPQGRVIGVDFTPAMLERANENREKLGLENVEFRMGDIESLPVEADSIDVILSNCVINLAPNKDAVFREAFRVLRSGGRLMVSDIVLTRPATGEEMRDMALLTGCISGSLPAEEYVGKVEGAGFVDAQWAGDPPTDDSRFWFSASITATKP